MDALFELAITVFALSLLGAIGAVIALGAIPVICFRTIGKPDRSFWSELIRFYKGFVRTCLQMIGFSRVD